MAPSKSIAEANALLQRHALLGLRLAGVDPADGSVRFEVVHVEWGDLVYGALTFCDARYLQVPTQTSWGYRVRVASEDAPLPSRADHDADDIVFELFTPDGAEPSGFVVATALVVTTVAIGND